MPVATVRQWQYNFRGFVFEIFFLPRNIANSCMVFHKSKGENIWLHWGGLPCFAR